MLGEGFDHPPLTVAAIFRPYASLAPYVQFVGRIMRVVVEGDPEHPDNQGWVATHAGLHVDRHWHDFRQLDEADQSFFRGLVREPSQEGERAKRRLPTKSDAERWLRKTAPQSLAPSPRGRSAKSYLPPKAVAAKLALAKRGVAYTQRSVPTNQLGLGFETPLPTAVAWSTSNTEKGAKPESESSILSPQQQRRHLQDALRFACRGAVSEILADLKLSPRGWQVFRLVRGAGAGPNYLTLTKLLHMHLNSKLGLAAGKKSKVNLEKTNDALLAVAPVAAALMEEIKAAAEESA